jgi:hypothetical protein
MSVCVLPGNLKKLRPTTIFEIGEDFSAGIFWEAWVHHHLSL